MSGLPKITNVRASVMDPAGDPDAYNWLLDTKIASQMSRWPEHREHRRSWPLRSPGIFVVEVETDNGCLGVGHSSGGEAASFVVERNLAPLIEGQSLSLGGLADLWDRMFLGTQHIGRRGLTLHAISAVDIALWDALGRCRDEPVWQMLGPRRHDSLPSYATTSRPDLAREVGFAGGKIPLPCGYAEGRSGLTTNLALASDMRDRCGQSDDFFLAFDCYMSLDVPSAIALGHGLADLGYAWMEEFLIPDDYWGHAEVREAVGGRIALATGEHEDTRWGFRLLLDYGCADILQPDLNWCGGLSEFMKIVDLADERGVRVVPHAGGVVAAHLMVTREEPEPIELVMSDPLSPGLAPSSPLFLGEPWPELGRFRPTDDPGFGTTLNPALALRRPFTH